MNKAKIEKAIALLQQALEPELDPYSLKTNQRMYVWNRERPTIFTDDDIRYFAVYMPKSKSPFRCFNDGNAQETATATTGWEHAIPVDSGG